MPCHSLDLRALFCRLSLPARQSLRSSSVAAEPLASQPTKFDLGGPAATGSDYKNRRSPAKWMADAMKRQMHGTVNPSAEDDRSESVTQYSHPLVSDGLASIASVSCVH